jgi:thiol-disulfide isomerase/thioredoxin
MKHYLVVVFVLISFKTTFAQNIIKETVNYYSGFGGFRPSYTPLSDDNKEAYKIKGMPLNWTKITISKIIVDYNQYYIQNFRDKTLSGETRSNMVNAGWKFDEKKALNFNSKCFFYVLSGIDSLGLKAVIIDNDNNLDFSNNASFYPLTEKNDTSILSKNIIQVKVDKNSFGQKKSVCIPFLVVNINGILNYSIPFYSLSNFKIDNLSYSFKSSHQYLVNATFTNTQLKIDNQDKLYYIDDIIIINGKGYKNLGNNYQENSYSIEKLDRIDNIESAAIGFIRPNFNELNLNGELVNLDTFKNKYLYLDFWATWCSPCLKEIPELLALYKNSDKSKLSILGITVDQKLNLLNDYLIRNKIPWDTINSNQIADLYRVSSLPSNFLINPSGQIIKMNISIKELEQFLKENKIINEF